LESQKSEDLLPTPKTISSYVCIISVMVKPQKPAASALKL